MSSLVSFRKGQTGRKINPELAANPFPPPPAPRRSPQWGLLPQGPFGTRCSPFMGGNARCFQLPTSTLNILLCFQPKTRPPK